jgi:hypothetical protein
VHGELVKLLLPGPRGKQTKHGVLLQSDVYKYKLRLSARVLHIQGITDAYECTRVHVHVSNNMDINDNGSKDVR